MTTLLHQQLDEHLEELRAALHAQVGTWAAARDPEAFWAVEEKLGELTRHLHTGVMASVLEAIHQDKAFVEACRDSARDTGFRPVDCREVPVMTLGGVPIRLKTPYMVKDRRGRPGRKRGVGRRGPRGSGTYPVLRALGILERATPAVVSEVTAAVTVGPSEAIVCEGLARRGLSLDPSTVRRIVRGVGQEALRQREQRRAEGLPPPGLEQETLAGKRVVISIDGGALRQRINRGGRRRKNGHHGFEGRWREPRLLVIYTIDGKGRICRKERPIYDGAIAQADADAMFALLADYLHALDAAQAQLLVFLIDGAEWLWNRLADLITRLGLPLSRTVAVLDWAHACKKLTEAADACAGWSQTQRKRWLKKQQKRLKQGQLKALSQALFALRRGKRAPAIAKVIKYLLHDHREHIRYDRFRAAGVPIGSGAVESAIRRVINLRLKGNGIFWKEAAAQRMIYLRCQLLSGRWNDFFRAVLTGWASGSEAPARRTAGTAPQQPDASSKAELRRAKAA